MNEMDPRRRELASNLMRVSAEIEAACARAGRSADEVTLVAVTKTWPAADVVHLAALGVGDIGENRDQEAAPKAAQVATLMAGPGTPPPETTPRASTQDAVRAVRWHFVGRLQRNKCASVVTYADWVQSVGSVRLAQALGEAAARRRERALEVLVQVSVDGDPSRGGAVAGDEEDVGLDRVLDRVAHEKALVLRGLMTVAPLGWDQRRAFAAFASIAERVRRNYPDASALSAGMSGDFEEAIDYGATHVRVGSALLGNRSRLM